MMNSNAVIGGANDGTRSMSPAETRGRPGTRAPHVALGPDRSTLDLFGHSFVLLRAVADDWAPPGVEAHVIDADGFVEAYGITRKGAVLIRPDGIVGWRSTGAFAPDDLTAALNSILALDWPPAYHLPLTNSHHLTLTPPPQPSRPPPPTILPPPSSS